MSKRVNDWFRNGSPEAAEAKVSKISEALTARAAHAVQGAVDTGLHQDPTELGLGKVLWLGENNHLLYSFKLKITQLWKQQRGNNRD